jgi:hypothetical protein
MSTPTAKKKKAKGGKAQKQKEEKVAKEAAAKANEVLMDNPFYASGVPYQIGQTCSFCKERVAFVYCSVCPDFLCPQCDFDVHKHEKRALHVRDVLTHMSKHQASFKITACIRVVIARKKLLAQCRDRMVRYYDPETRSYYYYNAYLHVTTGRMVTQWHKPVCLREEELVDLPTPEPSAYKIQGLYRRWAALRHVRHMVRETYDKIWSRNDMRFYYFNNSKSVLIKTDEYSKGVNVNSVLPGRGFMSLDQVSWKKPVLLYSQDLVPLWTADIAAIRIQGMWQTYLAKQWIRSVVRSNYKRILDPLSGDFFYKNKITKHMMWSLPNLLGKERWNPMDMREWDVYEVCVWFRRLRFQDSKRYVATFEKFQVNGKLLLCMEQEDFETYMGFKNLFEIRRLFLEIERVMERRVMKNFYRHYKPGAEEVTRRDRLRVHDRMERACITIQGGFRLYLANRAIDKLKLLGRLALAEKRRREEQAQSAIWWHHQMPKPTDVLARNFKAEPYEHKLFEEAKFPQKEFGRRRDRKGIKEDGSVGWGRWNEHREGAAGYRVQRFDKTPNDDNHLSRIWSKELANQEGRIHKQNRPYHMSTKVSYRCAQRLPILDPISTGEKKSTTGSYDAGLPDLGYK